MIARLRGKIGITVGAIGIVALAACGGRFLYGWGVGRRLGAAAAGSKGDEGEQGGGGSCA
ncbi:MAG: hypothetical protein EBZ46_08610 [Actinobacteria bacterium]|nr:hypothetical protein [Actinomycetota bacterium]